MTELPRPSGVAPLWSRPRARELGAPLAGPVRADVAVVAAESPGSRSRCFCNARD